MPSNSPRSLTPSQRDAAIVKADKSTAKPAPKRVKPKAKAANAPKADKPDAQALAARISGERRTAASIFAQADKASVSVPVKPLSAYAKRYNATVTAHAIGRRPSVRQATALAVCAAGNGKQLRNGTTIKRNFEMRGVPYTIENGALSDAIASGLCTYDATTETITIANSADIAGQLGSKAISI